MELMKIDLNTFPNKHFLKAPRLGSSRVMKAGQQLVLQLWHAGAVTSALSRRFCKCHALTRRTCKRCCRNLMQLDFCCVTIQLLKVQITFLTSNNDKKTFPAIQMTNGLMIMKQITHRGIE